MPRVPRCRSSYFYEHWIRAELSHFSSPKIDIGLPLVPSKEPLRSTTASLACRSEERRVGKEDRSLCDWSSDVCSSDLGISDRAAPFCTKANEQPLCRECRVVAQATFTSIGFEPSCLTLAHQRSTSDYR